LYQGTGSALYQGTASALYPDSDSALYQGTASALYPGTSSALHQGAASDLYQGTSSQAAEKLARGKVRSQGTASAVPIRPTKQMGFSPCKPWLNNSATCAEVL
jgi:hypothetical protein